MKRALTMLLCLLMTVSMFAGCTPNNEEGETTAPPEDPVKNYEEGTVYNVGPNRYYKSLTELMLLLKNDQTKKTIYLDEGVYDIFQEYKDAGVKSPPDTVGSADYFDYNVFLPNNTNLVGIGNVQLRFAPTADQITLGESLTWAPLNVLGECYVENIEIYCKNGRYCIHDDSHNDFQNTLHYYKNVRCTYVLGDYKDGQQLGRNNTIGNGMAQGSTFLFEDCIFKFEGGGDHSAFYTHEIGSKNPESAPTLTFRNCQFLSSDDNNRTIRLQNLATADLHIITTIENCQIQGGIYLTIYKDTSAQHFDVTLINSGNPPQLIDKPEENRYPIKVQ